MDVETLTRRFVDAYNSRQLEAQIELFDPEIELVPVRAVLEDTIYRGHDGIRRFARDLEESWSEAHVELLELEVRGEQAVSIGCVRLKGRSSGAVTEVTGAAAWSMRDERLLRMAYHPTVQDARSELGWED
jgi:ketosteroid isomerase-like protein